MPTFQIYYETNYGFYDSNRCALYLMSIAS